MTFSTFKICFYSLLGADCLPFELLLQMNVQQLLRDVNVNLLIIIVLVLSFHILLRFLQPHLNVPIRVMKEVCVGVFLFPAVLAVQVHISHFQQKKPSQTNIVVWVELLHEHRRIVAELPWFLENVSKRIRRVFLVLLYLSEALDIWKVR